KHCRPLKSVVRSHIEPDGRSCVHASTSDGVSHASSSWIAKRVFGSDARRLASRAAGSIQVWREVFVVSPAAGAVAGAAVGLGRAGAAVGARRTAVGTAVGTEAFVGIAVGAAAGTAVTTETPAGPGEGTGVAIGAGVGAAAISVFAVERARKTSTAPTRAPSSTRSQSTGDTERGLG